MSNNIIDLDKQPLVHHKDLGSGQLINLDEPTSIQTSPSKYDTGFVLPEQNTQEALNENRAKQQGALNKIGNGTVKMLGTTVQSSIEPFTDLTLGIGSALATGELNKVYDNPASRGLDSMNKYLQESFPNYYSKAEQNYNLLQELGTTNFWADKVGNGVGFMAGAILSGFGAEALTGKIFNSVAKLATSGQKAIELGETGVKALDDLNKSAKMVKLPDFASQVVAGTTGATGESSMEARQGKDQTKQSLIDQRNKGLNTLSDQEIEDQSNTAGNVIFGMNLAITAPINTLVLGKFFTGSANNELKLFNKISKVGNKFIAEEGLPGYITALESPTFEAGQEMSQQAIQSGVQNYYERKNDKSAKQDVNGIIESVIFGLEQGFGTKSGLEQGLIGALLGGTSSLSTSSKTKQEEAFRTANTIQLIDQLNKFKLSDSFKPLYEATIRHTSIENSKQQALENNDIFAYQNGYNEQFFSYLQSRIDTNKFESVLEDLEQVKNIPEDQFKKDFGFDESKPLPKSVNKFVDDLVTKAKEVNRISESVDNKFPNINTGIKQQLKFAAYGISDVDHREKSLSTKLFTIAGIDYRGLRKSTNYKEQLDEQFKTIKEDINPIDLQEANDIIKDLNKLTERRESFIKSYNLLSNPETRINEEERIQKTEQPQEDQTSETISENVETSTEPTKEVKLTPEVYNHFVNTGEIPEEILTSISDKLKAGKELSMVEQSIYTEKSKEIESKLQSKAEETPLESQNGQKVAATSKIESNLIEDDRTVNTQAYPEDDKKALTPYKSNNGLDDGKKPSNERFFRYIENNPINGTKFLVVTKNSNSKLYNEILDHQKDEKDKDGLNPRQFEAKKEKELKKSYDGVYLVLTDENNKIIKVDDIPLFSTLTRISRGVKEQILISDEELADIVRLRDKLITQTGDVYLNVISKSKGIAEYEKTKDGVRQGHSAIGRLGSTLNEITLELPTIRDNTGAVILKNEQKVKDGIGKLFVFNKQNQAVDLIPRTLNEAEVDRLTNLTLQIFGINPKTVENIGREFTKLINWGLPKGEVTDYTFYKVEGSSNINIGKTAISGEELKTPEGVEKLKNFLRTKRVNANKLFSFDDRFIDIFGIEHESYKEYLIEGKDPLFKTDLVPLGKPQFRNQYLIYNPEFKTSISRSELKKESEHELLNKSEEKQKLFKRFQELDLDDKINPDELDRLKILVQNTEIPLSPEETTWFKSQFPNISIEIVKGLIDNKSFGRFLSAGKVLLSDEAAIGTLYHEGYHVASQLYLSPDENKVIYNEIKSKTELPEGVKWTDLIAEEIAAENFFKYKETGKVLGSPVQTSLFKKLLNFIKDLIGLKVSSIEDIYRRLDKGYYTNKPMKSFVRFKSLNRSKIQEEKGVTFEKELLDGIDAIFYTTLFNNNFTPAKLKSVSGLNNAILKRVYNRIGKLKNIALDIYNEDSKNEVARQTLKNYDYILNNWDTIIKTWQERSKSKGVDIVIEDSNLEQEENKGKDSAYQEANQVSSKSTINDDVWTLISSLKEKNSNDSDKLNDLGLPTIINPTTTYNFLLKNLSGLSTYEELYSKIESFTTAKPELKELLNRIGKPSEANSVDQFLLQQQFRQDFAKNQSTSFITILKADGITYIVDANKENNSGRILEKWRNNIRYNSNQTTEDKLVLNDWEKLTKLSNLEFLKAVGFNISKETTNYIQQNTPVEFNNAIQSIKNYITINIGNISKLFDKNEEEGSTSEIGNLDYLTKLEAEFNPESTELSFISTEGKTVYSIGLNNALSITKNIINNSKNKDELFERLPHLNTVSTEGSLWLSELFDNNGNKRKNVQIDVNLHDGIKTDKGVKSKNQSEESTRKLSIGDKYVQEITSILTDGRSSYIRASDKSSEHTVNLNRYGKSKLAIPIQDVKDNFSNQRIKDIFNNYFKSEFKRIALAKVTGLGSDIDVFNKTNVKWTIFEGILKDKTKKQLSGIIDDLKIKNYSTDQASEFIDNLPNNSTVEKDIQDFLTIYSKEIEADLKEYNISIGKGISNKFKDYSTEQLVRAITVNDLINSIEQIKLFVGDMGFYKDLFKRTAAHVGTKNTMSVGNSVNNWLDNNIKRLDNKPENGKINVVVFEDINVSLNQELLDSYINSLIEAGYNEAEARSILKAYTSMDEGDAQGWITLDELRSSKLRLGEEINLKAFEKAQNGEPLTKEEFEYFKVEKYQYAGPQEYSGLFVPTYHKYSLMPLIPSMVKGTNLEKILNNMTKNQIGYALFKSGSKVGTKVDKEGKANKFYSDTNSGEINTNIWQKQVISYQYLGLQTKTSKPKDKVIFGTQFRKLLFSNLFEGGKEVMKGAEKLRDKYNKLIDDLLTQKKNDLIEELGLDPNNYQSKDVSKLITLLQQEAKDRNLADNLIDSIRSEIIEGKLMLKYKFDAMVNKSRIDSMIMSLVNSRLIRQKFNGDALVQVASSGFEIGKREIGTNPTLKFYRKGEDGKTIPAEVMIPMKGQYKFLLQKHDTIAKINSAIKSGEIDAKVLELIAYRIPTQGLNSMEYFTIKEFLPEESGTSIVVSTAIVAKSGSDFDIDKLNVFYPNLHLSKSEVSLHENQQDDPDSDKLIEAIFGKDRVEYDSKEIRHKQNQILEIAKTILSNSHNFTSLITPNSNKILKDVVDEIRFIEHLNDKPEYKGSKEDYAKTQEEDLKNIRYTNQLKLSGKNGKIAQFNKFLTAKDMIGITAVQNTHNILAQMYNLSINETNIHLDHNLNEDGTVSISKIKDVTGKINISEVISQILTSSVDAAKDPFVFDLNMTTETLGTYLYLIRIGVPFETVGYFMKQPIITEYLNKVAINSSAFLKAIEVGQTEKEIANVLKADYLFRAGIKEEAIEIKTLTQDQLKNNLFATNQNSKEYYESQIQVLTDYLNYREQGQKLSDTIRATNMDTAGVGRNLDSIRAKITEIEEVKKTKFVNGIDEILNSSLVKTFNQLEFVEKAFNQFYYTQEPQFQEVKDRLLKLLKPFGADNTTKLSTLIENDLISFVIQNYGYSDVKNLREKLFDTDSLAKKLLKLKNKVNKDQHEELLSQNLLIKELCPMLKTKSRSTDNVKIYAKRFDKFTSDQLTEAFREIKELDLELTKEIADTGILQSGLNNSPITYLGIIPFEYYNDLVKSSFENFEKKGFETLNNFDTLFLRNNKSNPLVYKAAKKLDKLGDPIFGKDYSLENKETKEETKPKVEKKEKDEPQLSKNSFRESFRTNTNDKWFKTKELAEATLRDIERHGIKGAYITPIGDQFKVYIPVEKTNYSNQFPGAELTKEPDQTRSEEDIISKEEGFKFIKDFTERLGVKAQFITTEKGKELLEDKWEEGTKAFYWKGEVYLMHLNLDDVVHEFSHPFVRALSEKNPTLFANLMEPLGVEHPDIYDFVEKNYKELFENGKPTVRAFEEMAVRAITKLAKPNIKNRSTLQRIWYTIKNLFRKVGIKEIDISKLSPNTTFQELADIISKDKINIKAENPSDNVVETSKEQKEGSPYKKQSVFFDRRIKELKKQQTQFEKGTPEYNKIQEKIEPVISGLEQIPDVGKREVYTELGTNVLKTVEDFVETINKGETLSNRDIEYIADVLDSFKDYTDLASEARKLEEKLAPVIKKFTLEKAQENSTKPVTQEDIDVQREDIGRFTKWTGSLADSPNIIASTIGTIIKNTQTKVSTVNKNIKTVIQEEVNSLEAWGKKNGVSLEKTYDLFIQTSKKGSSEIVKPFLSNGEVNPNFEKVQSTPELKQFYDFYQDLISKAQEGTPIQLGKNWIPNKKKDSFKERLKSSIPVREFKEGQDISNEELFADVLAQQFTNRISDSEKSRDLGALLLEYTQYSNNFRAMSEILPTVRILQRSIETKEFTKSSEPGKAISGKDSNLYQMIEAYINMQVFGQMRKQEGKIKTGDVYDDEGNVTGYKYILGSDIADVALKYNSLLRIGFSPVTAAANLLFGNVTNLIEGFGGRYFGVKDLANARNIYLKQTLDKESVLNKELIEKLNILQDLEDFDHVTQVGVKKLTTEKIQEYAYYMQKAGEKWIQSGTAMAIMIKEGYLTKSGELSEKYTKADPKEKQQLVDKIQRVNQSIHGRYTSQEAATLQQNILYRLAIQFKKWIPSMIESKFSKKHYDQRLQADIEGRYRTFFNLTKNIGDTINRIKSGSITELEAYNIRKNLVEVILATATLFAYAGLHGDDDKAKNRRKNWAVKTGLTLLNRTAGDLDFFFNPAQIAHTAQTPISLLTTLDNLRLAIQTIPSAFDEEKGFYKSGSHKDESKTATKFGNLIPGLKPLFDIKRIVKKEQLEELN